MKNELFNDLLASVKEMDKIVQGINAAARITEFPEPQVNCSKDFLGTLAFLYQFTC